MVEIEAYKVECAQKKKSDIPTPVLEERFMNSVRNKKNYILYY